MTEPVTEVAAGSPAYKVEWRGNKVFVQPLEPDAATNLFIWTAGGRWNYELSTVTSVEEAQFAIDQEAAPERAAQLPTAAQPAQDSQVGLPPAMLLDSRPVRLAGESRSKTRRVQVIVRDLYRDRDRVYLRYEIQNQGRSDYEVGTPDVFSFRSPQAPQSLFSLRGAQLVGASSRIRAEGVTQLRVVSSDAGDDTIAPGAAAYGVVAFEPPPPSSVPAVLLLNFGSDAAGSVTAYVVL